MNHKLEVDSIFHEIRNRRILSDVYIKCETGQISGIFGKNGVGKTCLMNIIYGNINPISKSIRFDNVSISQAFKHPELITYLPQFNFIPSHLKLSRIFSNFNLNFQDFQKIFPDFSKKYNSSIGILSGGQRRLIEVYVIIKSNAQFTMLDEPFSHLMPLHTEKMTDLLYTEKSKKGFFITDHMYRNVIAISDQMYALSDGKTILVNTIADLDNIGYAKI